MVQLENGGTTQGLIPCWWFFTTHLKNIQSKLDHFPKCGGNKNNSNPNHQLGYPGTEVRINDEGQWLIIITYLEMGKYWGYNPIYTNQSEKYYIYCQIASFPQIGETQKTTKNHSKPPNPVVFKFTFFPDFHTEHYAHLPRGWAAFVPVVSRCQ